MKKIIAGLFLMTLSVAAFAQNEIYGRVDILRAGQLDNEQETEVNGEKVRGLPFLIPEWLPAKILLKNGQQYENYEILYDAYRQTVLFLEGKKVMEINDPVQEFTIQTSGLRKSRKFINADIYKKNNSKPVFYELLAAGTKGQLLKLNRMVIQQPFEKVASIKSFQPSVEYFYYDEEKKKLTSLKNGVSGRIASALQLTEAQKQDLGFAAENFRQEADLVSFFNAFFLIK